MAPGDDVAWTVALLEALDPVVRARWAEGARRVRDRLPTWDDALDKMIAALAAAGAPVESDRDE
jgi:hypothetical protein